MENETCRGFQNSYPAPSLMQCLSEILVSRKVCFNKKTTKNKYIYTEMSYQTLKVNRYYSESKLDDINKTNGLKKTLKTTKTLISSNSI